MAAAITVNANTYSALRAALLQADGSGATVLLTRDVYIDDTNGWKAVDASNFVLDGAGHSVGRAGAPLADSLLGKSAPGDAVADIEVRGVKLYVDFAADARYVGAFCPVAVNCGFADCAVNGAVRSDYSQPPSYSYSYYVGGFVGRACGECSFENCVNHAALALNPSSGYGRIGGILALIDDFIASSLVMTNCRNDAAITAAGTNTWTGGIICEAHDASVTLHGCVNNGVIDSPGEVAGILVVFSGDTLEMLDCVNNGAITAQTVGGICFTINADTSAQVRGCRNTAELICNSGAGIINAIDAVRGQYNFIQCVNSGDILKPGTDANDTYVGGGIFGFVNNSDTNPNSVYALECRNTGAIDFRVKSYNIGGICGSAMNRFVIEDCVNTGAVKGGYRVGGILGSARGAAPIESLGPEILRCVSRGDVVAASISGSTDKTDVGGIAGWVEHYARITGCLALGTVTSEGPNVGGIVGGIVGSMYNDSVEVGGNIAAQSAITVTNTNSVGSDWIHRVVGFIGTTVDDMLLYDNYANAGMLVTGSNNALDQVFDYNQFITPEQDFEYNGVEVLPDNPNYGLTRMQGQNLDRCRFGEDSYNCMKLISPDDPCGMRQYIRYLRCRDYGTFQGVRDAAMLWTMYEDWQMPCRGCGGGDSGGKVVLISVYRAVAVPAPGTTYEVYRVLPDGTREAVARAVSNGNGVIRFKNLPRGEYVAEMVDMDAASRDYSIYRIKVGWNGRVAVKEVGFLDDL
ncbi:MAG: prealbumin-like fold domain-containing protein [Oscillospiraceae bacterium]|nr:prealbumin-like fold domain-containing protein [Oscillospiraceae bacterium]